MLSRYIWDNCSWKGKAAIVVVVALLWIPAEVSYRRWEKQHLKRMADLSRVRKTNKKS